MDIQVIRELAEKHTHAELEKCIDQQIAEGKNDCWCCETPEDTVNVLSKASYLRQMVEAGKAKDIPEAMRLLARSMRSIQQK